MVLTSFLTIGGNMCGRMPIDQGGGDMCGICSRYWGNVVRRRVKDGTGKETPFFPLCETHEKELDEKGSVTVSIIRDKGKIYYRA